MDFPFNPDALDLLRVDILNSLALLVIIFAGLLLFAVSFGIVTSLAFIWTAHRLGRYALRRRHIRLWRWCNNRVIDWKAAMLHECGPWIRRLMP